MLHTHNEQMILLALRRLFDKSKWFDICVVDSLVQVSHAQLPPQERAWLHLMHCVEYNTMPVGLREHLAKRVVAVLKTGMPDLQFSINRPGPVHVEVQVDEEDTRPAGFVQRLLGRGK